MVFMRYVKIKDRTGLECMTSCSVHVANHTINQREAQKYLHPCQVFYLVIFGLVGNDKRVLMGWYEVVREIYTKSTVSKTIHTLSQSSPSQQVSAFYMEFDPLLY